MSLPRPLAALAAAATTAATVATLGAATAGAQAPAVPLDPAPWRQAVAVNALGLPFGLFSAEYEAALPSPGFTVGLGGTWFSWEGDRDAWIEGKALYYPGERAFRGFSVGLTVGVHSARNDDGGGFCTFEGCSSQRRTQTAPTTGVLVNYDWLLGRQQRFRVGVGAGAKRVLRDVAGPDPLAQVYPDGRFVIGVAF